MGWVSWGEYVAGVRGASRRPDWEGKSKDDPADERLD